MAEGGVQYWQFIAGLGLFLFAMAELESALTDLAGGAMRRLLRRGTRTPFQGILTGTLVTAVLQSSSVVLLIVLAFVGARILTPARALGVVLGANLGTTFTGWIVATLGFKVEIDALAFPLVGLGGLGVGFLAVGGRPRQVARVLLGLGVLLLGLDFMKGSMDSLPASLDVARMASYPAVVYLIGGVVLTALIQSSSAALVIALSALGAGLITLGAAAAIVVGADLGTTSTAMLGAVTGRPEKKRVALAHFLVNVLTVVVAFPLIGPLLTLIRSVIGLRDPLYALVAFHSTFNLLGIVLVFPFLRPFSRFLEARFRDADPGVAQFIPGVPADVTEAAIDALRLETIHLISRVMRHNLRAFRTGQGFRGPMDPHEPERSRLAGGGGLDEYSALKHLEGAILDYATELQRQPFSADVAERLTAEIVAVRNALQSAKNIKDVRHNLEDGLRGEPERAAEIEALGDELGVAYREMTRVWQITERSVRFEALAGVLQSNRLRYESRLRSVHARLAAGTLDPDDVSTELNINREVYSSTRALTEAVGRHLLEPRAWEDLDALPETVDGGAHTQKSGPS